jgi:hypothetical protein
LPLPPFPPLPPRFLPQPPMASAGFLPQPNRAHGFEGKTATSDLKVHGPPRQTVAWHLLLKRSFHCGTALASPFCPHATCAAGSKGAALRLRTKSFSTLFNVLLALPRRPRNRSNPGRLPKLSWKKPRGFCSVFNVFTNSPEGVQTGNLLGTGGLRIARFSVSICVVCFHLAPSAPGRRLRRR